MHFVGQTDTDLRGNFCAAWHACLHLKIDA
jgi:hypothetical protein